jgi:hypothetical protein
MGEIIRRSGVPGWAWGIIFTSFLTLMSFTIGIAAGNQKMKDDIYQNQFMIEKHNIEIRDELDKKANKELMERNYEALLRIESKLDDHIKHTK